MKKIVLIAFILLLSISLFGCASAKDMVQPDIPQQTDKSDEQAVKTLVEAFGGKLQEVSLLAPADIAAKSMQESYGSYVSPKLLAKWQSNPEEAPGRMVSSPWPDRIEILSIKKLAEDAYEVKGEVIEITSTEKTNGGVAAKRPITLVVKKIDKQWRIDDVNQGAYEESSLNNYKNTQYGFSFSLPESWKGYTIVTNQWEGLAVGDADGDKTVEKGPLLSIRHPQWTAENPRQDIPIMIFTTEQWKLLQQDKFHIGAAPIGPSELGRNSKYVFALPARYNFAFPIGYEEVENILKSNPLQTNN